MTDISQVEQLTEKRTKVKTSQEKVEPKIVGTERETERELVTAEKSEREGERKRGREIEEERDR